MIQDFASSGLLEEMARTYRVIAFDRPGFGHSERPVGTLWSPEAQADLLHAALQRLGATPAVVLGHSWGALVAVAMGVKYASSVKALVLASGYFYPTARVDVAAASGPAVPILGHVLRYTLAPILTRIAWPRLMRKIFGPAEEPQKFKREFPKGLAVRSSQLRASAAESALLIPSASDLRAKYRELSMPVVIIAGESDRLVETAAQSARLHREVRDSTFHSVPGSGHMVHQTAMSAVMAAIDEAATAGKPKAQTVPSAA
jgi:pimeloyl-ACP methyl ester carboxylesterase